MEYLQEIFTYENVANVEMLPVPMLPITNLTSLPSHRFFTQRRRGVEFAEDSRLWAVAIFDATCTKVVRCENHFLIFSLRSLPLRASA